MKILFVGDVHAVENELADCAALADFVLRTAVETNPDYIVFLGDQHHNHNVMHVEVMGFWKNTFVALKKAGHKVLALVGNHDMTGVAGSINHAMLAYTGDVRVVDKPTLIEGVLFMPFYSDLGKFVEDCNQFPAIKTLVCHQTFTGTVFDGGFYAKDGIDPNLIHQELILSGHIHTPQSFGKVTYIGAPRWRILTDANHERGIWLTEFDEGVWKSSKVFSTGEVCQRLWHLVDTEEAPVLKLNLNGKDRWRVDVKGSPAYVEKRMKEIEGPGVKLHPVPDQTSNALQVRESDGIVQAFLKFAGKYVPKHGTPAAVLEAMVKERL